MKPITQTGYMPAYGLENPHRFSKLYPYNITVSVDNIEVDPAADIKILMQSEPPNLYVRFCDMVHNNHKNFDLILSYDDRILTLPNAMEFLPAGSWMPDNLTLQKKDQISFIMSSKINGHDYMMRFMIMYRYQKARNIGPFEFLFYRSPPRLPNKNKFFTHAKFNVACENQIMTNMFSEKLLDCFKTFTVPIYYGCANIEKYFNPKGIIQFNSIQQFEKIVQDLHPDMYTEMLPYMMENYELGSKYWKKNVYQRIEDVVDELIVQKIQNNTLQNKY